MTLSRCLLILSVLATGALAFAPLSATSFQTRHSMPTTSFMPCDKVNLLVPALQRQRKSVAAIQTQGLFGLGGPEIAIILVAAAFLLGPQKIAELGRDAGKIAGELKDVPKEFKKGLEEGETNARATKAKAMEEAPRQELAESSKE